MDIHDLIGLILEVFTWIGFGCAAVVLVILLIVRAADGTWVETHAVIVDGTVAEDGSATREVRWMTEGSELFSRPVTDEEYAALRNPDEAVVFYSDRKPSNARFRRRADRTRALRLLFSITAGVGAVSFIAGIVLLFIPS
ncbi:hypothetical protein ACL9RL_03850 [Plantibacter sp. Mn2098]|uniref:hypothetical protein n=1 Tax=Plantibacter sp. Mn2098 TaxID=3395266 RepID=UPI003BEE9253